MSGIPTVAIIVTNARDQVLLQLRDDKPDLPFPNYWSLPGGRVEPNEDSQSAAARELLEETGLEEPISLWKVYERRHMGYGVLIEQSVFIGRTNKPEDRLVLGEGQALRFFGQGEIASLSIAFEFDKLLGEFFASHIQKSRPA